MFIGFIDETEIKITGKSNNPDIYVFGGFFVEQGRLHDLQRAIVDLKIENGLQPWHPVKWNLKDLKRYYEEQSGRELYERLVKAAGEFRKEMLGLIPELDMVVMACGLYRFSGSTKNLDCYRWAFENLLQRVGLMVRDRGGPRTENASIMMVADWPQGGVGKNLFDIYAAGYHRGKTVDSRQEYYSGPLQALRFADALFHSSMDHCAPLQLADMVVGCIGDFLAWCYKGTRRGRVELFFPLIVESFHHGTNGQIDSYGLKVSGCEMDLDAKILELSTAAPKES